MAEQELTLYEANTEKDRERHKKALWRQTGGTDRERLTNGARPDGGVRLLTSSVRRFENTTENTGYARAWRFAGYLSRPTDLILSGGVSDRGRHVSSAVRRGSKSRPVYWPTAPRCAACAFFVS